MSPSFQVPSQGSLRLPCDNQADAQKALPDLECSLLLCVLSYFVPDAFYKREISCGLNHPGVREVSPLSRNLD